MPSNPQSSTSEIQRNIPVSQHAAPEDVKVCDKPVGVKYKIQPIPDGPEPEEVARARAAFTARFQAAR